MKAIVLALVAGCFNMPPRPQSNGVGDAHAGDASPADAPPSTSDTRFVVSDAAIGHVNIAFVSSITLDGGAFHGVAGADEACAGFALADSLPGTYVAWVAANGATAPARIGATARGWIRLDGLPIADTLADLVAGKIMYPIAIDDASVDHTDDANGFVITGANADGTAANNCADYSDDNSQVMLGRTNGTTVDWTADVNSPCTTAHIYCFGTSLATEVDPPPIPPGSKIVFVTNGMFAPTTGLSAADAACQQEANAGMLPGTFVALLATTTATAASRVSGIYVRPDGVTIGLLGESIITSINVTPAQDYLNAQVWTGAAGFTNLGTTDSTCDNWVNNGTTGTQGSMLAGTAFFAGVQTPCGTPAHLYCAQR